MSTITSIHSEQAPKAVGPYSQAVVSGGVLYASGQIGLDPETGSLVKGGVLAQCEQAMRNLDAVLAEAGLNTRAILKVNIFLTDMGDFPAVNAVYAKWLGEHRPARATVAVAALPLGAAVEMDLIASLR